jgi:ABC-type bacteriocin/lantibiotic exporter with double-glycine peptidase domain
MLAAAGPGWPQTAAAPAIALSTPYIQQSWEGCGSASIAMVMQYWDAHLRQPIAANAEVGTIQAQLYSRAAQGIRASSMEAYLRAQGYRVFAFPGQWSDLAHHLALGRPLIVSLAASGAHGPLHFVVVTGIDTTRGYVYIQDPARKPMLRLSREGFESEWKGAHFWTLLAVPQTPASAASTANR